MIIVPVLMLVMVIMVQMVLWSRAAQVANLAAAEGARVASSMGGEMSAGVDRARAVLATSGSDVGSSEVVVRLEPGDEVSVTVSGRVVTLLPGFSLTVSATQKDPVQEFRPAE